jgi:hypothetical protein
VSLLHWFAANSGVRGATRKDRNEEGDEHQPAPFFASTPEGTRTPNPRFRRPVLYPVELRAQVALYELDGPNELHEPTFWEERRGSNPQPLGPQPSALTIAPRSPYSARPGGFEPPAYGLEGRCSVP